MRVWCVRAAAGLPRLRHCWLATRPASALRSCCARWARAPESPARPSQEKMRLLELERPGQRPGSVLAVAGSNPCCRVLNRWVDRSGVGSGREGLFVDHQLAIGRGFRWGLGLRVGLDAVLDLLRGFPNPFDLDPPRRWVHLVPRNWLACPDRLVVLLPDQVRRQTPVCCYHPGLLVHHVVPEAHSLSVRYLFRAQDRTGHPSELRLQKGLFLARVDLRQVLLHLLPGVELRIRHCWLLDQGK